MHVVILGNGIAGVSTARRLRSLDPDSRITVVSGESTHHYSRPALMYVFMGHMRYQDTKPFEDWTWAAERIDLVRAWATAVDVDAKAVSLHGHDAPLTYDELVLATGSKPNRFGWPGQDLPGVQGLYDLMDLKLLYENTRGAERGVVVGGGLIGIELAEMLLSRGVEVTFLVRESSYWNNVLPPEEAAMVDRLVRRHGIDLRLETELREIHAGPDGRACAVTTSAGDRIECGVVGLTAGVSPNLDLVRDHPFIETDRGILVDDRLRTSAAHVWAAGDCAEIRRGEGPSLLQQVWYTGRMQGEHLAEVLAGGDAPYDPGIWFNSAKFFDLEYQTYGRVDPKPSADQTLFWQHPTEDLAFRLMHDHGKVVGFVMMGLRYRHEVCARWIAEERTVEEVLTHLADGNFDPEFSTRHEPEIARSLRRAMQSAGQTTGGEPA